jgi:hypothetical protein
MTKRRETAYIFSDQTAARSCPVCHAKLDATTGVSLDEQDQRPRMEIGDITTCAYCRAILTLSTALEFRIATETEIANLDPSLRDLLLTFPGIGPLQKKA